MARKTLLTETEIRQFMKLANIKPLQEMGGSYGMPPGMRDEEEEDEPGMRDAPGMRDMREEEEMEMDAEEAPAPEGGEEMDMEMGAEEPAPEMDMDMALT